MNKFLACVEVLVLIFIAFISSSLANGRTKRFLDSDLGGVFSAGVIQGTVTEHGIDEASGCAASRKHHGVLYTVNDHGGDNKVYALSTNGSLLATLEISGSRNADWEDLALGPCSATDLNDECIYIGDTGSSGSGNTIYRVQEPTSLHDQHLQVQSSLEYSWDQDDCGTVMVDPQANVYLISEEDDGQGVLFHLPNSAWGTGHRVHISSSATVDMPSTHDGPVGGDISPNGNEVLVKVRETIYYWNMHGSRDYMAELVKRGSTVPYTQEKKGESICWDPSGSGFFTMSEGINQPIYYYARI